jgi:hypothetical protein
MADDNVPLPGNVEFTADQEKAMRQLYSSGGPQNVTPPAPQQSLALDLVAEDRDGREVAPQWQLARGEQRAGRDTEILGACRAPEPQASRRALSFVSVEAATVRADRLPGRIGPSDGPEGRLSLRVRPRPPVPEGGNQAWGYHLRGTGKTAEGTRPDRERGFDRQQAQQGHLRRNVFPCRPGCNRRRGRQTGGYLTPRPPLCSPFGCPLSQNDPADDRSAYARCKEN